MQDEASYPTKLNPKPAVSRAKSEQKLMQTNFLSQLKHLQELLKENLLEAADLYTNEASADVYNEAVSSA